MILRDGRGVVHDLGARRVFAASELKIAAGYGENATGRWNSDMSMLFTRGAPERPVRAPSPKVAEDPALVRARAARYRERNREAVNSRLRSRREVLRAEAKVRAA